MRMANPRRLSSFSFEDMERLRRPRRERPAACHQSGDLPPSVKPEQAIQDHRLMVLFFDLSSMQVDDVMRALQAATDFIHTRMTPADLVAIVTYTSVLSVNQDFTNDRDLLDKVIHSIRVGESSGWRKRARRAKRGPRTPPAKKW